VNFVTARSYFSSSRSIAPSAKGQLGQLGVCFSAFLPHKMKTREGNIKMLLVGGGGGAMQSSQLRNDIIKII